MVPGLHLGCPQLLGPGLACHWQWLLAALPLAAALGVPHPLVQLQGLGLIGWLWLVVE